MASKKITKKKAGKDKEKEEEGGEEEETLMVTGCGDGVARVWSTSVFKWEVSPEEYVVCLCVKVGERLFNDFFF